MQADVSTGAQFGIVMPQSFYTVKGVWLPYAQAHRDVQVTTDLLNGERSGTQRELAETGWLGSAPLITAVLASLYDHQNTEGVEELRRLFAGDFRKQGIMTSTHISYRSSGLDVVTHDVGTPGQRTLEACLVGPDGRITGEMSEETQALFGNMNAGKVIDVYHWVTGKETYLWRLNSRPKQDVGRALVLGDGVDFGIGADGIDDVWPARGVRVAPQNSTGSKG